MPSSLTKQYSVTLPLYVIRQLVSPSTRYHSFCGNSTLHRDNSLSSLTCRIFSLKVTILEQRRNSLQSKKNKNKNSVFLSLGLRTREEERKNQTRLLSFPIKPKFRILYFCFPQIANEHYCSIFSFKKVLLKWKELSSRRFFQG